MEKTYKKMTKKELKDMYCEYYDLINGKFPCYGTKDMITFDNIAVELERRGITIDFKPIFN